MAKHLLGDDVLDVTLLCVCMCVEEGGREEGRVLHGDRLMSCELQVSKQSSFLSHIHTHTHTLSVSLTETKSMVHTSSHEGTLIYEMVAL